MSLKSAVFNIHTQLSSEFNIRIPRSHVYELLAASCGCKTYASLCSSGFVVAQAQIDIDRNSVLQRCREIESGHETQIALLIREYLCRNRISLISISYIQEVICTPYEFDVVSFDANGDSNITPASDPYSETRKCLWDEQDNFYPVIAEQLDELAMNGNRGANFILAYQMGIPDPEYDFAPYGKHSYIKWKQGIVLNDIGQRSAIDFEQWLVQRLPLINHLQIASKGNDFYSSIARNGLMALDIDDVMQYL